MSINRESVQKDCDDCSAKISDQSRTISFAVLALVWVFIAAKEKPDLPSPPTQWIILLAGVFCIVSLLFDYLQYLCGYLSSNRLLEIADKEKKTTELEYDYKWWQYQLRTWMFYLKQIFLSI